jgi:Mg2+ and Co2+ transporter CorA
MNVRVPGQDNLTAFYVVIACMFVILVAMVTWFKKRGWL